MCALVVGLCGCQSRKTGDSKLTDLDQQYKEKYERISEMNLDPVDESKSATADEEKSEAEPEDQPEEEIEAAEEPEAEVGGTFEEAKSNLDPAKTYAIFHTSMGEIITELYPDKAPKTVENFLGLATGSKEWTDPTTNEKRTDPLYNGTIFHRVIPGFMIQGGDPLGNGTGGPGYKFEDEFDPTLRHDQAGRLSMANSGKDTNGSQFFITQGPTPHLDDKHTIFGQVVFGQDAVDAIGNVARDPGDKPLEDVVVQSVEIIQPEAN